MRGAIQWCAVALLSAGLMACPGDGPTIAVTVSPAAAGVQTGATLQLQAAVTGTDDTRVRWSVQEGDAGGSVSAEGLYTAPAIAGTFHVLATSEADPQVSASATLTVTPPSTGDVRIAVSPGTASIAVGTSQAFSAAVTGTSQTAVIWTATGGEISQAGVYTAGTQPGTFAVTATSLADVTKSASATVEIVAGGAIAVTLTPASVTLETGAQERFTASVSGSADRSVTFSATCGTIDAAGNYTAPATPGSCTVTATSKADPTKSATANVTVVLPVDVQVVLTPSAVTLNAGDSQVFTAEVSGTDEVGVVWTATCGVVNDQGRYTAPSTAGSCVVTAASVAAPARKATATVVVIDPGSAAVTISPAALTLEAGQQQKFTASVTGVTNKAVSWSTTCGTIDGQGNYTAPATAGTCVVTARSEEDPTKTATANVQVIVGVRVAITPATVALRVGQQQKFVASVTGAANPAVSWSTSCGTIDGQGNYTAPAAPTTCAVTARSEQDPTRAATATVQVTERVGVQITPATLTLEAGGTQTFTATVTGATQTAVTWTATCGTISGTGSYVAPNVGGTCTVTATSLEDATASASAQVTVHAPNVTVTVTPMEHTMQPGANQTFVAIVSGSTQTGVTWSASGGTITTGGSYTAPSSAGVYTVTATSVANPQMRATARVAVVAAAYDLSGTVTTTGSHLSQPIFIVVRTEDGLALGGTRIAGTGGSFTVRGLTYTGVLHVYAFKDTTGLYNDYWDAAVEVGGQAVSAPGGNVTGVAIQLDPVLSTVPAAPLAPLVIAGDGMLYVRPYHDGSASRYRLYWSNSPNPGPSNALGSVTLNALNDYIIHGLANGVTYHVAMRAVSSTGAEGASSPSVSLQPKTVPAGARTLSGAITATGITRSGPLYVLIATGSQPYLHRITTSPAAVQSYSVPVTAAQLSVSFILDQGNDGILGVTDPGFFRGFFGVDTTTGNAPNADITLATGDVDITVRSVNSVIGGPAEWRLEIEVDAVAKMPVRVELLSGLGVPGVRDIGKTFRFGEHATQLELGAGVPAVGDAYTFRITFTDGTQQTLTRSVSSVVPAAASMVNITGAGTPTFQWAPPATLPAGPYTYQLDIFDYGTFERIWSFGAASGTTSVRYNADGSALPTSLVSGGSYIWYLYVVDENVNYAVDGALFTAP